MTLKCDKWPYFAPLVTSESNSAAIRKYIRPLQRLLKNVSRSTQQAKEPVKTIIDRNAVLTFGKYKNWTIAAVLEHDPQYILFCQNQIDWFDVSYEILEQAEGSRDDGFNQLLDGFNSQA